MTDRGEREKEREREDVLTLAPHMPTDGGKGEREREGVTRAEGRRTEKTKGRRRGDL